MNATFALRDGNTLIIDTAKATTLYLKGSIREQRGRYQIQFSVNGKQFGQSLATYLTGIKPASGQRWSHLNGNPLDYRAENLTLISRDPGEVAKAKITARNIERATNRVREPGGKMVGVVTMKGRYYARMVDPVTKKNLNLGGFDTPESAGRAYDLARVQYGLPRVNFPR